MTTNLLSVIEQLVDALDHCMGAITERGLNGSPDQAEKWGLQLPLERAYAALAAGQQALEQTQGEAIAWVLEWTFNGEEKGRRLYDDETHCKFDAEQDGGVCRPLVYGDEAHPQATEPAHHFNSPEKFTATRSDGSSFGVNLDCLPPGATITNAEIHTRQGAEKVTIAPAPLSHLKTETGAPPEQGAITSVNGSEPAPKRCGLCGDCDARAQKACTVPACFARDDYKLAPSTEKDRRPTLTVDYSSDAEDIREYCGFCGGDGDLRDGTPCPFCDGSGRVNEPAPSTAGELTLEQITRIYDRYGGDMVNCTRAIERELAAARSQPTTEESSVVAGAQPVREPASPSTAGERDNKTEMLAKLTAWLDSLGGKLHTYSLRGIALAGFEEGWSAALMQSTADHIAQNRKLVAALPVGELPEPFHPRASHINPDYRDGWNAALAAARSQPVREPL